MSHSKSFAPQLPVNHGLPWNPLLDGILLDYLRQGESVSEMARKMGRTESSVSMRLEQLSCRKLGTPVATPKLSKEDPMNVKMTHLLTLLQKDFTTVDVKFAGTDRYYTFKAPLNMTLAPGDRVVVDAADELKVACVVKVHEEPVIDFDKPYALKWVVQKVDVAAYEEQQAREAAALHMLNKSEQKRKQQAALEALLGSDADIEELKKLLNGPAA